MIKTGKKGTGSGSFTESQLDEMYKTIAHKIKK
jgi:hypothetical protein